MQALLQDVAMRAGRYLRELAQRKVAPDPAAVAALDALDGELSDVPLDPHGVFGIFLRRTDGTDAVVPSRHDWQRVTRDGGFNLPGVYSTRP